MCALVSSKDAKAKVFVRPGENGGQDARSGETGLSIKRSTTRLDLEPTSFETPKPRPRRS